MLNEIFPLKERIYGANCITLAISNVLKYKHYENYIYIWKQCGMNYIKKKNTPGTLNAKFMSITDELMLGDNIDANFIEHNTAEEMIYTIKSYINKGEPVIIFVDTFELKYHMFYKDKHAKHCVIITGYEDNTFNFVDDFYQVKDTISFETLKKATILRLDHNITHGIITVAIEDTLVDLKSAIISTVEKNTMAMQGISDMSFKESEFEKICKGVHGIEEFISEYTEYTGNDNILTENTFDDLYTILSRISNTRYLYFYFLSRGKQEFKSELYESLCSGYFQAGQEWKVCSNMMIKGAKTKQEKRIDYFNRMLKKLRSIKELELTQLEKSKEFISYIKGEVTEVNEKWS